MNALNKTLETAIDHPSETDYRKLWVETVATMAENTALKRRVELLEREIATHAFGGWQIH